MKNYYEILGVSTTATAMEIKKAYFKMVRQYPPDRFETEFMEIREAYENLSNPQTKQEYDEILSMSPVAKAWYEYAKRDMEQGNIKEAILSLEKAVDQAPHMQYLQGLLGEAYLKNENSGKAIQIFRKLIEANPTHAAFSGHLAHAYLQRGWHKKALGAYKEALKLDEDNVSLWLGLSEAYMTAADTREAQRVLLQALELGKKKEWDTIALYFRIIEMNIITGDFENMEKHVQELTFQAMHKSDIRENVGWALSQIARHLIQVGMTLQAKAMLEQASTLMPKDEQVKKLTEELQRFFKLEDLFKVMEKNKVIGEGIKSLIACEVYMDDMIGSAEMKKVISRNASLEILESIDTYRAGIQALQLKFPQLYKLKADFFDSALDAQKRKQLIKNLRSEASSENWMLEMMSMFSEFSDEDLQEDMESDFFLPREPYVREQPKVGRNEPCPCGSGRKYKKCCGR